MAARKAANETPATDVQTPPAETPPPVPPLPNANGTGGAPLQDAPEPPGDATPPPLVGEHIPAPTDSGNGQEAPRKRGRPKGSGRKLNPDPPGEPGIGGPRGGPINYQALAGACCDTVVGVLAGVAGPHWGYNTQDERGALVGATANYMRAKNMPDIPPGWLFLIAVSVFILPRLNHPETQRGMQKIGARIRAWKNRRAA